MLQYVVREVRSVGDRKKRTPGAGGYEGQK